MRPSPFLQDPVEEMARQVAMAVGSPQPEVAALHINLAIHHAAVADASGLPKRHALQRVTQA